MTWKPFTTDSDANKSSNQFKKKARFLVDECIGVDVARLLKRSGWNAVYVDEAGLSGKDDSAVFSYAHKENRVLLTHDSDFLNDRNFPEHRNPGIVILPGGAGDVVALIEALRWTLSVVGDYRKFWKKSKVIVESIGIFTVIRRDQSTGAMTKTKYWFNNGDLYVWRNH